MRVVVTGIGVVSPFGVGRERFWEHVSRGCSGTRAISDFDASDFPCRVAAPVTGVTIEDLPAVEGDGGRDPEHRADPKRYSRAALVGVIAAREAWNDAGLSAGEPGAGVIIGSGGGGIDVGERQYHDFFVEHGRKVTPYAIPISIVGMMSSEISISLRLHGVSHVLSCGCTSSTDALGYAAALIRIGRGRRPAVGRRRRLRHARDDLRLLADARRVDGLQRSAGPGLASVRQGAGRFRARRRRVDAGARARGSRACARRAGSTPRSTDTRRRATRITACRWRRTAREIVRAMTPRDRAKSGRRPRGDRLRQLPRHVDAS